KDFTTFSRMRKIEVMLNCFFAVVYECIWSIGSIADIVHQSCEIHAVHGAADYLSQGSLCFTKIPGLVVVLYLMPAMSSCIFSWKLRKSMQGPLHTPMYITSLTRRPLA